MTEENTVDRSEYITTTDNGVSIKLKRPVKCNGATYVQLEMREPTVADQLAMAKMKGTDAEKEIAMFANFCEVEPAVIHAVTIFDLKTIQQAYLAFVG